ncbi:hypothetical protein HeN100_09700 [Escherichia coli]|nr:hypothetical protein HeN100_09700 [Escherichia coli]
MMSLWDALRMNMMISYQELVRTFLSIRTLLLRFNHRPGRIFFAVEKITQLETEEINNGKEKNYSGL